MAFPSTFSTFNRPSPSDRLNNPSHSALHNTVSSAVGQLEAVVGLSGDGSVLGTILGDLRSPGSGGGGHIQTANKGGTGQTSYNKGDLLVATSSSVIAKLAVSQNFGDQLIADPTQASGIKWGRPGNVTNSVVNIDQWQSSAVNVLFAASIAGSTLGSSGGLKYTGQLPKLSIDDGVGFIVKVSYGVNSIATFNMTNANHSVIGSNGTIEGMIIGNNGVASQLGNVRLFTRALGSGPPAAGEQVAYGYAYGTSSINSSANQDLIITGQMSTVSPKNSILTGFFTVEKIA